MTASVGAAGPVGAAPAESERPTTLVWIDTRRAIVGRWISGRAVIERFESDVPARHRGQPHVRRDPQVRCGGGDQAGQDAQREEHLARFLGSVARLVNPADDVVVLGPGPVRDHLARHLCEADAHHGRTRRVESAASARLSENQLVTRLRSLNGDRPKRRTRPPAPRPGRDPRAAVHRRHGRPDGPRRSADRGDQRA